MNLTRALDVALPDIPARTIAERCPRLDPGTTFREHMEDGKPMVRIYVPTVGLMYRLPYQNWRLAQLFDGKRSYEEIAHLYSQETGVQYDPEEIREFAAELEAGGFWYKTALEKNILLMQQSAEERRKKLQGRRKWGDLSLIFFPAFNPDRFLTWLYKHTKFMYTAWFTVITIIAFAVTAGINITHWSEIGRDTLQFYNFKEKTWGDILYFYALFMIIVAVHEFAHAHACKHYGGRVRAMGFALIYLTPARPRRNLVRTHGVLDCHAHLVGNPSGYANPRWRLLHNDAHRRHVPHRELESIDETRWIPHVERGPGY